MNKTIALTAFAMFAAMMMIAPLGASVFAEKKDKVDVCHFSEAEIDPETGDILEDAYWKIININGNAIKAHEDKHGDGVLFDFVINDDDEDLDNDTSTCEDRNVSEEPEPDSELEP